LLATLLTAEGLLFAALAVSVSLQALAPGTYLPKFIKSGALAFWIFVVISTVATGAGAQWYELYGPGFPGRLTSLLTSVALAGVIIAQPILAFIIWRGSRT
jgi:hypothetical protein